jgi:hypothetical protein
MSKPSRTTPARPWSRQPLVNSPRPDVFLPPTRGLPMRSTAIATGGRRPRWYFIAAHGGSGAGLLSKLSWQPYEAALTAAHTAGRMPADADLPAYAMASGRAWPNPHLEPTGLAVVVCQTTMRGLGWARDVAAQYLSGRAPAGTHLLGVLTVADQPGRLPAPLAAAKGLLGGVYRNTWQVPYVAEYRLLSGLAKEHCPPIHPAIVDVLASIRRTTTPEGDPA